MEKDNKIDITVSVTVNKTLELVWDAWTAPEHILKWNNASDDWHTTKAENNLKVGGKFISRMEAKDGSFGFDFEGIYNKIDYGKLIEYIIADGRRVKIEFVDEGNKTLLVESFETENENSIELQREGWQAILNNFKKYCENQD